MAQRLRPVETACVQETRRCPSAPKVTCPVLSQGAAASGRGLVPEQDRRPQSQAAAPSLLGHGRTKRPAADAGHVGQASPRGDPRHPERPRRLAVGQRAFRNSPADLEEAPRRPLGSVPHSRDSRSREHGRAPPRSPSWGRGAHGRTCLFPNRTALGSGALQFTDLGCAASTRRRDRAACAL